MDTIQYNKLFAFLWNIATDVLVNKVDATEYKKIILPFIVLRRLDLLLEPSKQTVLDIVAEDGFSDLPPESQSEQLYAITGYPFYNTSAYTMKTLCAETDRTRLYQNFEAYLDGYSYHVQDIIRKFDLKHSVSRLSSNASLGLLISKFTDSNINLGIHPVLDDNGNEKLPGVDNHTIGTIFEELLRKFNEEYAVTSAGEHYTPRDYVRLLADLAIIPVKDKLKRGTYEIYDAACGTGGILGIAEEAFQTLYYLLGEGNFGQQVEHLFASLDCLFYKVYVYFGLSGRGYAVQQHCVLAAELLLYALKGLLLKGVEFVGGRYGILVATEASYLHFVALQYSLFYKFFADCRCNACNL
jgi:type I restriction enzyme M protein